MQTRLSKLAIAKTIQSGSHMELMILQVCFDLKRQVIALLMLHAALCKDGWPEVKIEGPVVDVRIAQCMLYPGYSFVSDSPEKVEACMASPPPSPSP